MKWYWRYIVILCVIAPIFYWLVLIPNFKACVKETGTWRACTQWLIR